jgi:transposase
VIVSDADPVTSREDLLVLIGLLREQNAALAERCALLEEQNALLTERCELLQAENKQLRARVAELERRLGRNSGNSNLPPSTDVFGRPKAEPKPGSGRARGKQQGASGRGLALVGEPDEVVDHRPGSCADCGVDLDGRASEGFARRQVSDIPLVTVTVTEHRLHKVRCGCGRLTAADAPEGVAATPASYGSNLRALAAYLLVHQHVPVQRAAELIADLTGAEVSTGWVASVLAEAAELVAPSIELIRALLVLGHVLHADETTTRIGSKRHWLHVACTEHLTLLGLAPRSRAGADSLDVLPAFRGTLVHDSLSLYAGYDACAHQLCGAHLIRELTAAEQDHPTQHWHRQIRWALSGLNKQTQRVKTGETEQVPPETLEFYLRHYHQGVAAGLSLHPRAPGRKQTPARNLLERLRDRADQVLRFADHPRHIPFTNNTAERALRPVKTQIKISGCHQSETGAAAWLGVRSYLDSARKHGLRAFDALRRAFTRDLWLPPITLPT